MTLLSLIVALAVTAGQSAPVPAQADAKLIRVFIQTDDQGEPSELAARLESVPQYSPRDRSHAGHP